MDTFRYEKREGFFNEKLNVRPYVKLNPIIQEKTCRTDRYMNSAIPYMSRLPNNAKIVNP